MDAYLDAKLMLFDGRNGGAGAPFVLANADDPAFAAVRDAAALGQAPAVTGFGVSAAAGLRLEVLEMLPGGMRVRFAWPPETDVEFVLPMLGRFNAHNAAAAFGAATLLGVSAEDAVRGLERFPGVPGRLERVDGGREFVVVVDYAHTPDALERALAACREHARGRVLCVFGCGGDRDRGKRPLMGAIAARLADLAWVTNDNPRSESPAAIAAEIVAGAPDAGLVTLLDRREAISAAVAAAEPGDIVLIAGKGHETTQTIGDQVLPFDDREVARAAVEGRP
jgi:UDP-N-acetylmuramoyl-L-alanyl-D-glutamate--2,6-diaminopimelate ligase